jgi:uncharacterized repeat protein (TIGR01451 family)
MNASRRVTLLFCAIFVMLFGTVTVHGAAFTPGNLVLYRVNDGAAALSANGTAVFLDEYTTAGALVQSIPVPTTTVAAQRRLVCSGTATTEGFLTRSTDGQYVVFSGYDAALGTASITTSTSATVPRVIGRVAANGTLDTSTALTDAISGGNPRGAASTNGTDLWLSGTSAGGGVRYATFGATTSTSLAATPTNLRVLGIFGSQLYTSSQSGAFRLATVGSGTPTTAGQTITNLPGFPTATGSPQGFFFADLNAGVAGVDTVYVADDGGTVQKYSLVAGSWTANGTIALATARGLTGSVAGSNVTLYVTARTTLRTLTDTSGYNATITGAVTTLATAAANTAMQGVAFVPQGAVANAPVVPTCASPLTTTTGTATSEGVSATDADGTVVSATITGITPSNPGTITLTGFTPAGGVGGTANATLSVSAATPANTYSVTIQWANNDGSPQTANCVVSVVVNAPPSIVFIHDVQGPGAATPIPGSTVIVEGIVVANFQGSGKLGGFFLQEEDTDADANPATSEGIFIFCGACPTPVAEGQKVQATGAVSEFNNLTEITASTAPSVLITNAGNNLALVTPSAIDLPIAGVVDDFYEAREGMKVTFVDTLTVSEYFELERYGQIVLYEGGRPRQFTEANPPSVAGNTAQADNLSRRKVILDDDNNTQEWYLTSSTPPGPADGSQFIYYPRANGGFSVGTQGTDFFRGGDLVNGLTGVLHWSFPGFGADTWRIRPTAANPATFTVANPRPGTPPAVGGAIKVVGMNLLNYFTTIDTTASTSSGPCAPGGTLDCRGADSAAELNRQRERASVVVCALNADVYGFMELENTTASATITDLLGAINARCGGAHPYTFVNTGGTLGTDAIRVQEIYRTGIVAPVGSPLSDLDPVHNRPPTAQTFDVVDAANPAFGQRFTVVANHFKSKGCPGTGADADAGDGQGCFNGTRTAQATRLLAWITSTVLPAAGDPDVLLLGDFNSYAKEDPVNTLIAGGYSDLETVFHGANAYSYLFDGQLGHLDYGFASASMLPQVTGADAWHINADEAAAFDYNDEVRDAPGEAVFEEKPDGSALVPPRVVFQSLSPYRASDHDPVTLGLFAIADLVVTKTDSPDPVNAGSNLTYTITVTNNGPDSATTASWSDTLPAGTTFVSLPAVAGWSCTTPAVGAAGTVSCSNPSFGVGSAVFTLTVNVAPSVADGTVLSNTATATSATAEGNSGDESDTETTTVAASADLQMSKTDTPDPVNAGSNLTYQITLTNNGPSNAAAASFSDTLPAGTTFVSLSTTGPWSCTTPAVGAGGTVSCTNASFGPTVDFFTLVVAVAPSTADGTVLSNTASLSSTTSDPNPGNESDTATTTVGTSADLSVTKTDTPDPVNAGNQITYTITVTNAGPSNAASVTFTDTFPAGTTMAFLAAPGAWVCPLPAAGGPVVCTHASLPVGTSVFTLKLIVDPATAAGTVLTNNVTVSSATTSDPNSGNDSGSATTTVAASADVSVTKVDTPDPVNAGNQITYTLTVTNAGPSNATSVTLTDAIPAGTTLAFLAAPGAWVCPLPPLSGPVVCTHASLPVGVSNFTLKVIVDPAIAAGTVLTNNITVSATSSDPNSGNDSANATTTVATSADLSVTKVDTPDPVTAGNNLTYTITVNNAGPSNASTVALADTLPAGTTFVSLSNPGWSCTSPAVGGTGTVNCSIATMAPGSAVFTLVVNVNASTAAGTVLTNTATATSTTSDPNTGNESGTATTTVASSADLSVTKVDTPDPVTAGNNLTYTITVNNAGPSNASTVSLTDTVPANTTFVSLSSPGGWTCGTPAVGGTGLITCTNPSMTAGNAVFTLVVNVNGATIAGTVITNTATVTSTTSDPSTGNESGVATTTVGTGSADLSVTKTDTPDPVAAGSSITYTITVNNAGPSAATTATLNDAVPTNTTFVSLASAAGWSCTTPAVGATGPISCNIASMPVGSAVFTLTVLVDGSTANGTVITNSATGASATTDPNPGNNTGTATTTVTATSADLSVTKTDNADPVTAGTNLTYTITVNNAGPNTANLATLSDTVPADTTFVSLASPGGWTCTTPAVGATGAINCSNPGMIVGSAVFTLVVAVDANAGGGTILTNTATAASTTIDPNTGNESDTETTNVISPATLTATKAVTGGTRTPGGTVTYTVTINNAGPAMQGDDPGSNEMIDVLPSQLTLVSANASSGTAVANVGTNTVTWNGSIPAGGSVTITIQALVNVGVPVGTSISNQATINYDADGNGTNEATTSSDDTTQPGATNPTAFFVISAQANVAGVPALDGFGLAALAALLAAVGFMVARRS